MNLKDVITGMQVVRSKGDYVVGRIGAIIDINEEKNRAQIAWQGYNKTWVSIEAIEPANIPYRIIPAKHDGNGRRMGWPQYVRL